MPSHDDTSNKEVQFVNVDDVPCAEAGEGVKVGHIHVTDSATAWIVHFAPGSRLPQVDEHDGEEHYFVLRGDLIDGDRHHRAGDWVVMPAGSSHQPGTDTGAVLLGISLPRQ
ncbi:cupin domain-containing protein [Streptomyces sp. AK02-04a]|uniref:cupin domain-containing protein n=1 Tax=Streptomyces sp. AK02-04a TaxID=3028649 RepID=UPI0029A62975|nr:cupin domain-containing protein [Streptomyces sp. AK02-04a]MDX3760026.1 cupin domain-containing protein [Streptomyces sp. AK02-04a]